MWGDKKMKKFAIVLMMALLVLGCVFAASGDNVILEVKLDKVVPLFEIYGDDTTHKGTVNGNLDNSALASKDATVTKNLEADAESVTLKVIIQEVGLKEDTIPARKDYIRFKGVASISVTATSLKNIEKLDGTDSTKTEEGAVTSVSTITGQTKEYKKDDKVIHKVETVSSSISEVKLTATYTGEKVSLGDSTTGDFVSSWTWTWNTTDLVGGETYRADIYLTYTGV